MLILDAAQTALALPWLPLVAALERTLADQAAGRVQAPERWTLPVAPGTTWFLMPAWLSAIDAPGAMAGAMPVVTPSVTPRVADGRTGSGGDLAVIKLITYAAGNPARGLPAILGDVLVMRASTGERLALLDGPTVTARRTAAVTLLATQRLAARPQGPLLIVGTGVQAMSHLQALTAGGSVSEVWVHGRNPARSADLVARARALALPGVDIAPADDLTAALAHCPLVLTVTSAQAVCLHGPVRDDAFVAAVGAFTPQMIELDPALTRHLAATGQVVIDSPAARHEAGDLLAAGLAMDGLPTLADRLLPGAADRPGARGGAVLFKSCGAALWDLAAARCVTGR